MHNDNDIGELAGVNEYHPTTEDQLWADNQLEINKVWCGVIQAATALPLVDDEVKAIDSLTISLTSKLGTTDFNVERL